jgi:bacterioferritin
MKGDPRLVDVLNSLLADELTAISQYMVHAEICDSWGYKKLHKSIEKRAFTEMRHAEKLIERILFLEGIPIVSNLREMHIGSEIPKQLDNDYMLELAAIKAYNEAIKLAGEVNDFATRDMLEQILNDEDRHVDEIEELKDQISHMTLPIFLTTQVEEK